MSSVEAVLTGLLHFMWIWRTFSMFYSSYSLSELVTVGGWAKAAVTVSVMATSAALQLVPRADYPRLSLANRLLGIPAQAYSIYFMHKYIGGSLDSRRVNIFLYLLTVILILETLYMLSVDFSRID